jgi:UDP-3-O-[3-hydroxymyristoyl] glucosamine N-acyltransferase
MKNQIGQREFKNQDDANVFINNNVCKIVHSVVVGDNCIIVNYTYFTP